MTEHEKIDLVASTVLQFSSSILDATARLVSDQQAGRAFHAHDVELLEAWLDAAQATAVLCCDRTDPEFKEMGARVDELVQAVRSNIACQDK